MKLAKILASLGRRESDFSNQAGILGRKKMLNHKKPQETARPTWKRRKFFKNKFKIFNAE